MQGNTIKIDAEGQKHLNAYINYSYNNGEGSLPYSPENMIQYQKDQAKYRDTKCTAKWVNSHGRECKNVGPSAKCFCDHRFKDHNSLNPVNKMVKC